MIKLIRKLKVMCGVGPWRHNNYVAAWNQDDKAAINIGTSEFFKAIYIEKGLTGMAAAAHVADKVTDKMFIVIDKDSLPINRKYRDDWWVDYKRNRVITRIQK